MQQLQALQAFAVLIVQARRAIAGGDAAQLSDADLVVACAAQSVRICGGPILPLYVGRRDAECADPEGRLPREDFTALQLQDFFAAAGFGTRDLVCLSGAHTLGQKGFGDPGRFDNTYFQMLLRKPWNDPNNKMAAMIGLPSDHALPENRDCLAVIQEYSKDQGSGYVSLKGRLHA